MYIIYIYPAPGGERARLGSDCARAPGAGARAGAGRAPRRAQSRRRARESLARARTAHSAPPGAPQPAREGPSGSGRGAHGRARLGKREESVPPQDGVHRGVHGALRDECEAQGLRVNLAGPTALIQSTRAIKSTSECMAAPSQTPDESKRRLRRLSRLLRSRGNPQCMGNPSAHARTPRQAHALPRRAPLAAPLANRPRRALRE